MSHFSVDTQQRPTMRRKSSAQNLLNSFKSTTNTTAVPSPIAIGTGSISPATGLSFAVAGGATTPITSTAREFDAMSLHSDTISGSTLGGAGSPQLGQGTSVEYLRDLVQKRIITLTYMRNIHEGRSHWFHTILISRADLEREFSNSNPDMRKRTYRFAILGMSLSNLLDINQPQDLLRGLINTISEYDQTKDDSDKSKMRQSKRLFRPKIGKRGGGGGHTEYAGSSTDGDTSYLMTPHMPFPLDYHQTLLSLLDVISEVYNKISKILGPSPFSHSSQHMMGPLGLLSPHPGVSYLFSLDNAPATVNPNAFPPHNNIQNPSNSNSQHSPYGNTSEEMSSSLWSIANASLGGGGAGSFAYGGALGSPPPSWSAALGEMVLKIDGKFKKITSTLLKELDAFARNGIKDELASLDPLLRNLKVDDGVRGTGGVGGGRVLYDFEGM